MTEDEWRDKQLNEHLEEDNSELSNCCDAEMYGEVCSECSEFCVSNRNEYEDAMCDRADSERELRRER